ncbi:MAG: tRNA lysidine(34) synthetase TilS [Planctomycetota bacterium]
MSCEIQNKVAAFIRSEGLTALGGKITVAVSGGADSVALIHILSDLKNANRIEAILQIAHINHQLRGQDSEADELFVAQLGSRLGIEVIVRRVDVRSYGAKHKLSIETAARQLRLEGLSEIAKENGSWCVATAHQKNDNAETVLHRLWRGCGFRGLGGIEPKRVFDNGVTFIRPLLCLSRDEVIKYLKDRRLNWRTDRTNYDVCYTRNFIRHQLIESIQNRCKQDVVEMLCALARQSSRLQKLVDKAADPAWEDIVNAQSLTGTVMDIKGLLKHGPMVRFELFRRALTRLGSGERHLTEKHYKGISALVDEKATGRLVELPSGFFARREYDRLVVGKSSYTAVQTSIREKFLEAPGQTSFGEHLINAVLLKADQCDIEQFKASKSKETEWFDFDKIVMPLKIRYRRAGDRFVPFGLKVPKKLGKFLTNERIKPQRRNSLLVIEDSRKIIWVAAVRASQETAITEQTRNILQLQVDLSSGAGADRFL